MLGWNNASLTSIRNQMGKTKPNELFRLILKHKFRKTNIHLRYSSINSNLKNQFSSAFHRNIHFTSTLREQEHYRTSESAAYEGSGKTTISILNEDVQYVMIDSFSLSGFRLNTGLKGKKVFSVDSY